MLWSASKKCSGASRVLSGVRLVLSVRVGWGTLTEDNPLLARSHMTKHRVGKPRVPEMPGLLTSDSTLHRRFLMLRRTPLGGTTPGKISGGTRKDESGRSLEGALYH